MGGWRFGSNDNDERRTIEFTKLREPSFHSRFPHQFWVSDLTPAVLAILCVSFVTLAYVHAYVEEVLVAVFG